MITSFQVNLPDATYHYTDTTGNTDVMDINATAIAISSVDKLINPISIADAAGVMSLKSKSISLAVIGETDQIITAQADYLEMPNIKPVQIYDNTNSGGTAGQYLGITGDGLTWEIPPAQNLTNVLAQSGDAGQQPITNLSSLAVAPTNTTEKVAGVTVSDIATPTTSTSITDNGLIFKTDIYHPPGMFDIYRGDISANVVDSQMVISTTALKPSNIVDIHGSSGTRGQLLTSSVLEGREYIQWVDATEYTPPLALVLERSFGPYVAGDANYLPITNLSSLNLQNMAESNSVTMAPVFASGPSGGGATLSLGIAPDTSTRSLSNKYLPLFIGDTMYYLPLYV
jgi:hypothetical protein